MAKETCTCEEIEIALLSEAELTENQKNHIQACQDCAALLSRLEQMKTDLGRLSVPGIEEGKITEAVMKKIREEKPSSIKFKWTHHMGTVAAAIIVLVAALIVKNPSAEIDSTANDTASLPKTASIESGAAPEAEFHLFMATEHTGEEEIMRSVTMSADYSGDEFDYTNDSENHAYDTGIEEWEDTADSSVGFNENLIIPESAIEKEKTYNAALSDVPTSEKEPSKKIGSAGGGGSAGGSSTEPVKLFENVVFLDGEENFDYNISVANSVLEQHHPDYIIKREVLEEQDYNNERFVYVMSLLTERDFIVATNSKNTIFIKK